jgi:3-phenylpropionate/cinnamic acid dioxygenase small subunit
MTTHLDPNASRDATLTVLRSDITDFLFQEAELLDERRYKDWLDLLSDDLVYFMPLRRNVKYGDEGSENTREGKDIAWFDEDKWTLAKRVDQILTGIHWAEEPQSRISHLISNVRVTEVVPSLADVREVVAKSHFLIYQNRVQVETTMFVGRRTDRLRREDGHWKLVRREILLDQSVLLAKNLTVFF